MRGQMAETQGAPRRVSVPCRSESDQSPAEIDGMMVRSHNSWALQ